MATISVSSSEWRVAPYWSVSNGSTSVVSSSIAVNDTIEFNQINVIDAGYLDEPVGPDAPATYILGAVTDGNFQDFLIQCEGPVTVTTEMFEWAENPKFTVYNIEDQGMKIVYVRQKMPVATNKALGYNAVGFFKDKIAGDTESFTIASNSWSALSSSDPYDYSTTVTATHTIGGDTIVELLNDNAVEFATYGFAIGSISGQVITLYSIGQPSGSETLKINLRG